MCVTGKGLMVAVAMADGRLVCVDLETLHVAALEDGGTDRIAGVLPLRDEAAVLAWRVSGPRRVLLAPKAP